MLSPALQSAAIAMNCADWPEEAAVAATPPSKAAMRCVSKSGLGSRCYLFKDVCCRVHDTSVDVAMFLEAEPWEST